MKLMIYKSPYSYIKYSIPILILTLFLFSVNILSAQLYVENSDFLFVNDQVVFVEDDINLNDTNSRIFLRDEAQLIQGSGTTGNSGLGELSLYQEGTTNAYAFNFWCSPVGDNATNNTTNNPFGITFLNDVVDLTNSTPAGTSVNLPGFNGTASPLNIEPFWIFTFVGQTLNAQFTPVQDNTLINAGEGFTMKGTNGTSLNNPGSAQRYDFRGKPNNGLINVPAVSNTLTLVGNPYPSALDALAYIHDPDNRLVINGTLFFWEQDTSVNSHNLADFQGGYATYTIDATGTTETFVPAIFNTFNNDGSVNNTGLGTGTRVARRFIPIGQGFFVQSINNGVIQAKNSHRAYVTESDPNSSDFFGIENNDDIAFNTSETNVSSVNNRTEDNVPPIPDDFKRFRLNIDFDDVYTRQLLQNFHPTATDGFDYGLETASPQGVTSDAYWISDNGILAAQAFNYREDLTIPLTLVLAKQQPIRFRIFGVQNFGNSQPIYLHDRETGLFIDLRSQNYELNLEAGTFEDRFEIRFANETLSVDDEIFREFNVFQSNQTSELIINNPMGLDISNISLYDVAGRRVFNENNVSKESALRFSTNNYNNGVYIVDIAIRGASNFSQKVIISNNN